MEDSEMELQVAATTDSSTSNHLDVKIYSQPMHRLCKAKAKMLGRMDGMGL